MRYHRPVWFLIATTLLIILTIGSVSLAHASTFNVAPLTPVSGPSPFAACDLSGLTGTNYLNAEVEPWVDVNPHDPSNIIAVWQQDRWSNGGARGLVAGVSHDGGTTWTRTFAHFSKCSGGTDANGGNYERASDPWVSFSPNGVVYQISLSVNFTPSIFATAILVSRSTNGGDDWSEPVTVIRDTNPLLFNDKESITADPNDSAFVYAVWDRSRFPSDAGKPAGNPHSLRGDILFARTTDGGETWEPARTVFKPGDNEATVSNQIAVTPYGTLIDTFQILKGSGSNKTGYSIAAIRSTDHGQTWSAPLIIDKQVFQGAFDPDTGNPIRAEGSVNDVAVAPNGDIYVAWQDSRFRGVDGMVVSKSTDDGLTWSAPVPVNQTPTDVPLADQQAFIPSIDVANDGTVAVTYYDFRNNTAASGVPTDYWIVHCHAATVDCSNAANWGDEARLSSGSFDIEQAPAARGPTGFFVGDYEALASVGNDFLPVFIQVNDGNAANRTDVFATTVGP
jgi:BNR repeat-like domain